MGAAGLVKRFDQERWLASFAASWSEIWERDGLALAERVGEGG